MVSDSTHPNVLWLLYILGNLPPDFSRLFACSDTVIFLLEHFNSSPRMSRHNRRRSRTHHKPSHPPTFELPVLSSPFHNANFSSVTFLPQLLARPDLRGDRSTTRNQPSVQFLACQRQLREAERMRIFGGSSGEGDEEGLCDKMMAFFGGLDFIHG